MATLSVRHIAQHCLGVTSNISINTHFYGYIFRDTNGSVFWSLDSSDTLPGSGQATTRSLKRHLSIAPLPVEHAVRFAATLRAVEPLG
jgi:hypothetical protein